MLTIEYIQQIVAPLAEKYNIEEIYLFGSYATGNASEDSDVDFLVKFVAKVPSIFKVMGLRQELEYNLNHSIDIVTIPVVRPEKLSIDKVVSIYERAG